jgi:hypothetical protein
MIRDVVNLFGVNPFPGLRAFKGDEARFFFGRDRYIDEAASALSRNGAITIAGRSGCGKSSFVQAGFLPCLYERNQISPIVLRPGSDPIKSLTRAIVSARPKEEYDPSMMDACETQLRSGPNALVDLLHANEKITSGPQVVIVDQFEEVFRKPPTDPSNANFVQLLLSIPTARLTNPVLLVLILRSEFLGEADYFSGLSEIFSRTLLLLPRLTGQEISEAIANPLARWSMQRLNPTSSHG